MYKLEENGIMKLPEKKFIPIDPGNRDYQEYLKWLKQGNKPIDKDIPIEAIDLETLTVDEQKLFNIKKNEKLNQLNQETTNYIQKYYPDLKQKSDIIDKEYYTNYLLSFGIDEIKFRDKIKQSVLNIYDDNSNLDDEVNSLIELFPVPVDANNNPLTDPNLWKIAIEQLLKVAIRVEFTMRVKQEYYNIKNQIENAATLDDLNNIVIEFTTVLLL